MTLQEIRARQTAIRSRLLEIEQTPTPDETADEAIRSAYVDLGTETDGLLCEFDTLETTAAPLQVRADRIDALRNLAIPEGNTETAFHAPQQIRRVEDPFCNLDGVRSGMVPRQEMRSRALAGIERGDAPGVSDDARHEAAKMVDSYGPNAARYALLTGSPAYRSAFEKILENPTAYQAFLDSEESDALRAALSTTVGNGGYAIPFLLDPTIILTNAGTANPFRQIARTVRGTSNKWQGVTSAGVTASWKTEGSAAADASPTVGQPAITANLADAYVFGSYEVFEDTNLAADLPMLVADAKDRLESDAFAVGSGSGAPYGVVTRTTAVTASRVSPTTGGTFTVASSADIFNVMAAVPPRHRSKATWVGNYSAYSVIRQQSPLSQGSAFWANMGAGLPSELLGRPQYEASAMDSAFTTGSNILLAGDFQNYIIYDRIGMSVEYIQNVMDSSTARPTAQRGWFATWRVGADVANSDAFRILKL
jgi:HK97 family phage major capsid protein